MFSIRLRERRDYNTSFVKEFGCRDRRRCLRCRYYYIISSTFTFEMIIVSSVLTRVRARHRV
jgi:hypothetical protein